MLRFYPCFKFQLFALVLSLMFLPQLLQAQLTVRITVTSVSTDVGDCDGDGFLCILPPTCGDNELVWRWGEATGLNPQPPNYRYNNSDNGHSASGLNVVIFEETYACESEIPASVDLRFRGCENDNVW
ncbi:MAG: hypothetical protein ACOCZ8_02470, partial [Bacteroidota bacterium]